MARKTYTKFVKDVNKLAADVHIKKKNKIIDGYPVYSSFNWQNKTYVAIGSNIAMYFIPEELLVSDFTEENYLAKVSSDILLSNIRAANIYDVQEIDRGLYKGKNVECIMFTNRFGKTAYIQNEYYIFPEGTRACLADDDIDKHGIVFVLDDNILGIIMPMAVIE